MPIHPTAIIDRKAELDTTVDVGPFCIIEGNVRVEPECKLYHNVYLTGWTEIGAQCVLHPGVIVGHVPQDTKYGGERSTCRVGRGTILREHVTVHRGTIPESQTVIGEECFLFAGCHVAHNCTLGSRVTLVNNVLLAGHVEVADRATIGGSAGVHQFVRIGELVMVAGNATQRMDAPPYALIDPAGRVAGLNRVGLRRAEVPLDQRRAIRDAYRIIYERGYDRSRILEELAARSGTPGVAVLHAFLSQPSQRGLAGLSRRIRRSGNA